MGGERDHDKMPSGGEAVATGDTHRTMGGGETTTTYLNEIIIYVIPRYLIIIDY